MYLLSLATLPFCVELGILYQQETNRLNWVKIYDQSLSLLRDATESQRKMIRMGQWRIWVISGKLEVGRGQRQRIMPLWRNEGTV